MHYAKPPENSLESADVILSRGKNDRNDRALSALVAVSCILAALGLYYVQAQRSILLPPCPFHWLTGLHCPGCGSSRAVMRLLQGDLFGAARANVLLLMALPAVALMFLSNGYTALTGRRWLIWRLPAWGAWSIFAVVVLFWFLRNLPMHPFDWLAPR